MIVKQKSQKKKNSSVGVVFVHHNDQQNLENSLVSLKETALSLINEIIIVDNISSSFHPQRIKQIFPQVKFIFNRENVGFARANNQALSNLTSDYVLLVNPDTKFLPGALPQLLAVLEDDPQVGAVGPLLSPGRNRWQASFGQKVNLWEELVQKCWRNIIYSRQLGHWREVKEVGWISAACLLARREALLSIQGFDEQFFLYFEDIDLCYRLRQKGWRIMLCPQARVYHWGGTSTSPKANWSRYHYRRSQLYFYQKYNSPGEVKILRFYLGLIVFFLRVRLFLSSSFSSSSSPPEREVIRDWSQLRREKFNHEK